MEVAGRRPKQDEDASSTDLSETYCQPCEEETGKRNVALKYCQHCDEYLCSNCCDQHKKFKSMKHHQLFDVSEIDVVLPQKRIRKPTIPCRKHPEKIIEYYCPSHNVTLCGACAMKDHIVCKPDFIPDIAAEYKEGEKHRTLQEKLDTLPNSINSIMDNARGNIERTKANEDKTIDEIRRFRELMELRLKNSEKELITKVKTLCDTDVQILEDVIEECMAAKVEVNSINEQLSSTVEDSNDSSDFFIQSNDAFLRLGDLQRTVDQCVQNNQEYSYGFKEVSVNVLSSKYLLGSVYSGNSTGDIEPSVNDANQSARDVLCGEWIANCSMSRQNNVNVKLKQDRMECWVTGMAFEHPNTLLLTDFNNQCVKRVHSKTSLITSSLPISGKPWAITVLDPGQAAVTVPCKQLIQVISTKAKMAPVRQIKVNGKCDGIASTSDLLVVSFGQQMKVEILDHYGKVQHSVSTNDLGQALFSNPWYVSILEENRQSAILVSDMRTSSLTKLSFKGRVLETCQNAVLMMPTMTVATGDEYLLVCCQKSHTIQVLSGKGERIRALVTRSDGIERPQSFCYNSTDKTLYISCCDNNRNELRLFKLHD